MEKHTETILNMNVKRILPCREKCKSKNYMEFLKWLIFFVLPLVPLLLFSQPSQTFQWGVKAGGKGLDIVTDITSIENNLYVTGRFGGSFSSGGESTPKGVENGIYVLKLDKNGNTSWVRTLLGTGENNASRITSSGENILLGGTIDGKVQSEKGSFADEGRAIFISRWNENGKVLWLSKLLYNGFATLDVLESTPSEGMVAGGMFQGSIKTDAGELVSPTDKRAYLITLTSAGKPAGAMISWGKGSHRLISSALAKDGGHYLLFSITGDFGFGNGTVTETPHNMDNGLALVKTTVSGETVWTKIFPGTGYFEGIKSLVMPNEDIMICANFTKTIKIYDTVLVAKQGLEAALLTFDGDGRLKSAQSITSPVSVRIMDAMLTHTGNLLVSGYFRQAYTVGGVETTARISRGDMFLLQTDQNQKVLWHDEPGQDAASFTKAITLDQTGNIIFAGAFNGQLSLRDKKLISEGEDDILIARYFNCLQKEASITGNPFLCEGGKTELQVTGDFSAYLWNGQWGKQSLTVTQPGRYTIAAYDRTGCASTDTIEIKTLPPATLGLPAQLEVFPGQEVALIAASGFHSYLWNDELATPDRTVQWDSSADSLKLTLTAVSGNSCPAADTVMLKFARIKEGFEKSDQTISAWPNPVTGILTWSAKIPGINTVSVILTDAKGVAVYRSELNNLLEGSIQKVDMTGLASGNYLLSLKAGDNVYNHKIVKK